MRCRPRQTAGADTLAELLSGKNLCLIRGDRCLFRNIEFALEAGELLLVEGVNGSGKTSLLKAVVGLLEFESGQIDWNGAPVAKAAQQYRASLVWFSHRNGFKGDLTAVQNLQFESGLRAFGGTDIRAALSRVGLAGASDLPMRVLSAGQQRRVGLARMLLADAPLWIMDEPFTNLDTDGQALVLDLVGARLKDNGMCVIASHQAVRIDAIIHRIHLQ